MEFAPDVVAGPDVGGGGDGDARDAGKGIGKPAKAAVFGTEIMPPLAHAMRLVDGDERDLHAAQHIEHAARHQAFGRKIEQVERAAVDLRPDLPPLGCGGGRSEEHTSDLPSLMRISYAVFCLKKNKKTRPNH